MNKGSFRFHFIMISITIIALKLIAIYIPPTLSHFWSIPFQKNRKVTCKHVLFWLSCVTVYIIDSIKMRAICTFTKTRVKSVWILIEYSSDVSSFSFVTLYVQNSTKSTMLTSKKRMKRSDFNSVFLAATAKWLQMVYHLIYFWYHTFRFFITKIFVNFSIYR